MGHITCGTITDVKWDAASNAVTCSVKPNEGQEKLLVKFIPMRGKSGDPYAALIREGDKVEVHGVHMLRDLTTDTILQGRRNTKLAPSAFLLVALLLAALLIIPYSPWVLNKPAHSSSTTFVRTLSLQSSAPRMAGPDVRAVQQRLAELQYLKSQEVDSIYGPRTAEAVMTFQRQRDLPVDGIVGKRTWEQLMKRTTTTQGISRLFNREHFKTD